MGEIRGFLSRLRMNASRESSLSSESHSASPIAVSEALRKAVDIYNLLKMLDRDRSGTQRIHRLRIHTLQQLGLEIQKGLVMKGRTVAGHQHVEVHPRQSPQAFRVLSGRRCELRDRERDGVASDKQPFARKHSTEYRRRRLSGS